MSNPLKNVEKAVAHVAALLDTLRRQGERIMAMLDDLQAQVAANGTVIQSVITLVQGLVVKLQAALDANDPAKVQAVIDQLKAQDQALAAAVAANTPTPPAA